MSFSWKVFQGEKHVFRSNSYSTFSGWVTKQKNPQMGTHISAPHRRLDARRAVYHQFHQFLIAWVATVKLDVFRRQTLVPKCSVRKLLYWASHTSLDPVSKADGILAKIFIYNILQQRLGRLLLAVLRRKRGRRAHEWGCRSGSGSAGRSAGGGAEDQAKGRKGQRRRRWGLHLLLTS